jgi:hypothetical protein
VFLAGVKLSVTLPQLADREEYLAQIDRLVNSHVLHSSESLCKMLQYLGHQALDHPGISIKEYQIATEVFGRPADFDPHLDATIRVQLGRLRTKLSEYYGTLGLQDPIVVELPKGSHALSFHRRVIQQPSAKPGQQTVPEIMQAESAKQPAVQSLVVAIVCLSVLLAASIATIIGLAVTRKSSLAATPNDGEIAPPAFQLFWGPFLRGPEEPWVVFSNAAFIGRPETGMRYFISSQDSSEHVLEHYTGVGEVLAVHNLDNTFGLLKRRIRVKRGSMFTLDDAKNNDLIFVGSPAENLTLRDIPSTHDFVFQRVSIGPRKGDLAIFNVNPQPGEAATFLPNPGNPPLTEDFSIIALVRGLNPARSTLILAGTSTIGTQAAVEFVTQPDSLQELLRRLTVSAPSDLKPFEAVIRVKVARGVPVGAELVALRKAPA